MDPWAGWVPPADTIDVLKKGLAESGALPGGSKWVNDEKSIVIRGLPEDTTDKDLYEIFGTFGAIQFNGVSARLTAEGTCTGIAFINFLNEESAIMAVENLNGTYLPSGK